MKTSFTGIGHIFKFAFVQTVKSKAFKVTQIIMCVIALLAFPIIEMMSASDDEEKEETKLSEHIDNIYIQSDFMEGKLSQALMKALKESKEYGHSNISVVDSDKNKSDIMEQIEKSENGDVCIVIEYSDDVNDVYYGFNYYVYYGENIEELDDASEELSMYVDDIHEKVLASVFINDETASDVEQDSLLDYIASDFSYDVKLVGVDNEIVADEGTLAMGEYWVTYAFMMIAIFTISIGGSKVSEQLVTEKSTKVIEYIMTSVKPMALIMGKVLASVASVLFSIGSAVVCLVLSGVITGMMFPNEDGSIAIPSIITTFLDSDVLVGATPISIIVAILLFVLGVTLYGFIGGIAGATVSKIEEMAEGVKLFTFTMIIGAYLPMIMIVTSSTGGGDWGIVNDILYILPITSVFIVPGYILIGKITLVTGLISLAVMIAAVILMLIIVSGIFEYLIYYNGSPLKLKDLIRIYKDRRRAK